MLTFYLPLHQNKEPKKENMNSYKKLEVLKQLLISAFIITVWILFALLQG